MKPRPWTLLIGLTLIATSSLAEEMPQADAIRFSRDNDVLFLNAGDLAKALDWEFKIVDPRQLVTFCRDQEGGVCIPIRLAADNHRHAGEELLIAADAVRQALRFRVVEAAGRITVAPTTTPTDSDSQAAVAAFNSEWGRGRGFGQRDTLPDIPLVDMAGKEVRFSQFLGKRYILYCWASW